jgi:hypothetical protein
MNKTEIFALNDAADANAADYDALRLTDAEYRKLLSCGHPGGTISVAHAGRA